ncbi:MAG: hypothetical protein II932_02015 [Treponema sp.]|nr:hypothetical protein [Treponema sp.]
MQIDQKEVVRIAWAIGLNNKLKPDAIKALANYLWLSIYPNREPWKECPKNPFEE